MVTSNIRKNRLDRTALKNIYILIFVLTIIQLKQKFEIGTSQVQIDNYKTYRILTMDDYLYKNNVLLICKSTTNVCTIVIPSDSYIHIWTYYHNEC